MDKKTEELPNCVPVFVYDTATSCAADGKSSQRRMVTIVIKISIPDFNIWIILPMRLAPITPLQGFMAAGAVVGKKSKFT